MSKSSSLGLNLLEWAALGIAVAAFTITEEYHWYITAGMLLLPVAIGLRWARSGQFVLRTGLELPLLIFLASAGLATWIAVDRETALLQFARMLAASVIFYSVIQSDRRFRPLLVVGLVLVNLALALYWPLQHDFSADPGKFHWIAQVGVWINQHFPAIHGPFIHANVASSVLAPGLVFSIALAVWAGKRRLWLAALAGLSGLALLAVLVLTSSRGAWLGGVSAGSLAGAVLLQQKWFRAKVHRRMFWGGILVAGCLALFFLVASGLWEPLLGQVPDPTGSFQSRLSLWQQVALLIGDTPFTGFGLMGFRLVYATYGILIHVPFQDHAHNTYMEIAVEQGIPGLLALLWGMAVVVRWAWRSLETSKTSLWGWAGLAALGVVAVHSLFDAVYYVTRPLPLIGLYAGLAWMLHEATLQGAPAQKTVNHKACWLVTGAAGIAGLVLLIAFFRPLVARGYANLGVLQQTRLELSAYNAAHFDNPTLDEVRQQLDLSQITANFECALDWNATDRTALQRLAQIALSTDEYHQALTWMQTAWEAGHRDEITRLLLGDALAAAGKPLAAAEMVRGLPWAAGRLNTQAWYRYVRQQDYTRAAFAWQAVLSLDPNDTHALSGMQFLQQP